MWDSTQCGATALYCNIDSSRSCLHHISHVSSCPAFHQSLVIVGNTDKCTAPCRHRESAAGVQFGASLFGVGLAATAYHASSGKLRKYLRKLDYWSISLSTTAAVRAALPAKSQVAIHCQRLMAGRMTALTLPHLLGVPNVQCLLC